MQESKLPYIIARLDAKNYTTKIWDHNHQIIADEPLDKNGQNLGMTPKQLLAGSLASCTTITLKMYADRKEWPIDAIEVEVACDKIYDAEDPCLDVTVKLEANLDEAQRKRMALIATKCPIHKVLSRSLTVNTVLI